MSSLSIDSCNVHTSDCFSLVIDHCQDRDPQCWEVMSLYARESSQQDQDPTKNVTLISEEGKSNCEVWSVSNVPTESQRRQI